MGTYDNEVPEIAKFLDNKLMETLRVHVSPLNLSFGKLGEELTGRLMRSMRSRKKKA